MALPASGNPISIDQIRTEMSNVNGSLTTLSTTEVNVASSAKPNGQTPHSLSEFYSYDHSAESQAYDFGNAIFPDGVNDSGLTASNLLINSTTDWIVSFWVKGSGSSNTTNMIMTKNTTNGNYIYMRTGSTPYIRWQHGANNTREDWSDSGLSGWDDGNWHHVYFYRVGNDRHLVFDGVDYGDGGASAAQSGVDLNNFFERGYSSTFYSNVAMDDLVIHETTGGVAQAQALYNSGDGANPTTVLGATPKYWYKFNINNGDTTVPNDGTIGSNDLTLSNFSGTYISSH